VRGRHDAVAGPRGASCVRRLYRYLCSDIAAPVPSDAELEELTYGNLLAAETLAVILARLRGKTFDQVVDDLPEHDDCATRCAGFDVLAQFHELSVQPLLCSAAVPRSRTRLAN